MKTDIHPEYKDARIVCACGNVIETRSTVEEIHVEICSSCHPFFTGKQKLIDTAGRVEKFRAKYGLEGESGEPETAEEAGEQAEELDAAARAEALQKAREELAEESETEESEAEESEETKAEKTKAEKPKAKSRKKKAKAAPAEEPASEETPAELSEAETEEAASEA